MATMFISPSPCSIQDNMTAEYRARQELWYKTSAETSQISGQDKNCVYTTAAETSQILHVDPSGQAHKQSWNYWAVVSSLSYIQVMT